MRRWLVALALTSLVAGAWLACASAPRFAGTGPDQACESARAGRGGFADADLEQGRAIFDRDCAECHSLADDATRPKGPQLDRVVSRRVGSVEGFRYSPAFEKRSDAWSLDALDHYLEDPEWYYPGTRMRFDGLAEADERADLLAFLACETR